MAFNWSTFKTRTLTALIFAAVMLTGLLWNQWSFFILFSIIHFGCWWEYLKLTEKICQTEIDKVIKYFLCICGFFIFLKVGFRHYSIDFVIVLLNISISFKWLLILVALISLFAFLIQNRKIPAKAKWLAVIGLVYISLSLGLLVSLYNSQYLFEWWVEPYPGKINQESVGFIYPFAMPAVIIASLWVNDTMAYLVGSLIGRTPLSKISPKKTWEGTLGGILLSVVVVGLAASRVIKLDTSDTFLEIGKYNWYLIPAIAAIAGTFGDLLESKLKRMAGAKDSGSLMPGHGGFLDRFDSLLLATPAVWIYVKLFML